MPRGRSAAAVGERVPEACDRHGSPLPPGSWFPEKIVYLHQSCFLGTSEGASMADVGCTPLPVLFG